MQTIKLPRLFWAYLRRHARLIALFAVFSLVFGVVFALYDLPVEAVAYASAICLALGSVAAAFGLNAFRHRHEALVALRENAALGVDDMPPPRDLLEEDLQAIIRRLQSGWQEEISRADQERADMLEYYTLWVHQAETPLAAMGLLLAGREDAAALEAERFKLERYVDMALQYARLGADASDFVLRECALAPIVRGAVRKYARLFIAKRIHLTVEEMDARVLTDDKWLSFAIEQLLSNAVKYTGENGHIRISLCEPLSLLVIEDDGIGIPSRKTCPACSKRGIRASMAARAKSHGHWPLSVQKDARAPFAHHPPGILAPAPVPAPSWGWKCAGCHLINSLSKKSF